MGRRWSDFSMGQRVAMIIGAIVQVSLLGAALFDLRRRSATQVRGPKLLWTVLVFVNYIGPVSYFTWGRKRR